MLWIDHGFLLLDGDCFSGGYNINNLPRQCVQGVANLIGVSVDDRPSGLTGDLALSVWILGVFKDTVDKDNIKAISRSPPLAF